MCALAGMNMIKDILGGNGENSSRRRSFNVQKSAEPMSSNALSVPTTTQRSLSAPGGGGGGSMEDAKLSVEKRTVLDPASVPMIRIEGEDAELSGDDDDESFVPGVVFSARNVSSSDRKAAAF
jgi:hypothetical protein